MNNIIDGNVVTISNGCNKMSTLSSKNVRYNIAMIKHFSPKQDLMHLEEEQENLFEKRLVARKGFRPSMLATVNTNITCRNN